MTCIKVMRQRLRLSLKNRQERCNVTSIQTISVVFRKDALLARQADLIARLAAIEQALDERQTSDWDDLAIAREDDEVLEATGLSGQQELRKIAAALERIDHGNYGVCVKCGAAIGDERLNVLPYTPVCRSCAT